MQHNIRIVSNCLYLAGMWFRQQQDGIIMPDEPDQSGCRFALGIDHGQPDFLLRFQPLLNTLTEFVAGVN
jgi:hypothetical protein